MRSMVSPGRLAPPAPFLPRPPDPGAPDPSAPDPCVVPTISVMLFLFLRRACWGSARRGRRWRAGSAACPATVAGMRWTCGWTWGRPSARWPGVGHPATGEGGSGARIPAGAAEIGDLLLEVFYGGERAIDAREAQVRHFVQLAQWTEDGEPHLVAGDLGGTPGPDGLLDPMGELGERVLVDGPALAGAAHAAHDLVAAERLGHATAFDDGEHGLLNRGEPTPAGGAGAATAGGLP